MAKKRVGRGAFYCWRCGEAVEKGKKTCLTCGARYNGTASQKYGPGTGLGAGGIGWSDKAGHPAFKRYTKSYWLAAVVWCGGLSILVPALMLLTDDIEADAEGLRILGIIVGIFWLFGLGFVAIKRGRSKLNWDGVVEHKQVERREKIRKDSDGQRRKASYDVYVLSIRKQNGKLLSVESIDTPGVFDQFQVGDTVRYHGNRHLNCLEKYDKRLDSELFCVSCGAGHDPRANYCSACGCPLLKGQPAP